MTTVPHDRNPASPRIATWKIVGSSLQSPYLSYPLRLYSRVLLCIEERATSKMATNGTSNGTSSRPSTGIKVIVVGAGMFHLVR